MLHEEIEFGHSGEVEFLGLNRWTWKLFAADSSWLHICHMLIFVHLFICSYVHIPHAPQATSSWLGHFLFYHVRTLDLMHWQPCSLHQSNCDMAGNVTCHLHDSMLEDWTRYGTDVWQLQVIYIADAIFAAALPVWVKAQGTDWTMPHSFFLAAIIVSTAWEKFTWPVWFAARTIYEKRKLKKWKHLPPGGVCDSSHVSSWFLSL